MPLEIISKYTRTCEAYTQDVHLLGAQTLEVAPCNLFFRLVIKEMWFSRPFDGSSKAINAKI